MSRLEEEGHEVHCIAFSAAESALPPDLPRDTLREEIRAATQSLGLAASSLTILNYPVREFPSHRQSILDDMIRFKRELAPELVLLPSSKDTHQDHQVVAAEGF